MYGGKVSDRADRIEWGGRELERGRGKGVDINRSETEMDQEVRARVIFQCYSL